MSDEELRDVSEEDDLFGDEEDAEPEQTRQLDDDQLDSGDDEGRNDRNAERYDDGPTRKARVMFQTLGRHAVPTPSDGELHTFRVPAFLAFEPKPYDSATFTIPTKPHHNAPKTEDFSASTVADTTIRFRKNPETGALESNTLMSRWSDGSVTLHIGDNDYELQMKPLAPPRKDPKGYQETFDSHQYLTSPHTTSGLLQVVGHITNQLTVQPNKRIADAALEKLAVQLQAATRGRNKGDNKDGIALITNNQDPELQRKEAEQADKERMRAQRRRETAAARAADQAGGGRSRMPGGLTLDDMEGRLRAPGSAKKKRAAPSGPRRARKRADYSSDEDEGPRGRNREDEYDMEDDFLAASDEELEEEEGSEEDVDEGIAESPKAKKQKIRRSDDEDADADEDIDAEGELDDEAPVSSTQGGADAGRNRKRNIIAEDDDDE